MPQGIIVKGIGGFYYVKTYDKIVECKARGKFRNSNITPLVGDIVELVEQKNSYVIDSILPRKTELIRPPVANVNQVILVFAAAKPEPNIDLIDRFLLLAEYHCLCIIICINKIDLAETEDIDKLIFPYKEAGYRIIYTSTIKGYGIQELKSCLINKITVFAGPSGVGKSSLLNSLQSDFNMQTGEISEKIQRGKQTTRHTELMELNEGGYVLDSPGFSSLDIDFIDKDSIQHLFPEFHDCIERCRFTGCSHISEPGCAVKESVQSKQINDYRYNSYIKLYNEIKKIRRNYK